jgi:hypothetical protein
MSGIRVAARSIANRETPQITKFFDRRQDGIFPRRLATRRRTVKDQREFLRLHCTIKGSSALVVVFSNTE